MNRSGRHRALTGVGAWAMCAALALAAWGAQAQVQRSFINLGFEQPALAPNGCYIITSSADVPGWETTHSVMPRGGTCTSPAGSAGPSIELWRNLNGTAPRAGLNHAELNAFENSRIYQSVCLASGEVVDWRLSHRGRGGTDVMSFNIDSSANQIVRASTTQAGVGTVVAGSCGTGSVGSASCDAPATVASWADYSGSFVWNGTSGVHSFGFEAISSVSPGAGNFLDQIVVILRPYVEFFPAVAATGETQGAASVPALRVTGIIETAFAVQLAVNGGTATLGTDFSAPGPTFTVAIPAGDYGTGRDFPLPVSAIDDDDIEGDETVTFAIVENPTSYVVSSTSACGAPANADLTWTIADNDTDLSITKTDGSDTYVPGFDTTYTIVVTNNGPSAVTGAQVSDPLPAGITAASWTCGNATGGGVCGAASGTGAIATTADLPAGASVTYTLTLGIPIAYTGELTNTATVAPPAGMTDANPDNNQASDTNAMAPPPTSGACAPRRVIGNTTFSLAPFAISGTVTKSGAPNGWNPDNPWSTLGGNYTFRWTFSQPVPANWIRFVVSDVGATNYQATPARFTITLGAGSTATPADFSLVTGWHPTFSDLAYNASTGVMAYVPSGEIKQAGALQGNSTDTVTSITITTTNVVNADYIVNLLYVRPSCLTLEKVSEGGTGPFTIDMTNVAEADGTVVPSTTLTTTAPGTPVAAAMLFFSPVPGAVMAMTEAVPQGWNNTAAICTDQNAGVTGNPTVIGSFASPTITIPAGNVRPEADIHCRFTNELAPEVDLSITKDDGAETYVPGFDLNYTIVVSNTGPGDVVGARVSDPLPAGIASASWTCNGGTNGGTCGAPSGTGAIDTTADLPAGASVTYTLNMLVPPAYTGDLTNTATVAVPDGYTESNTGNNSASDTDTMEPPPTSGACSPLLVVQGANFTLAPFPTTGTVQKTNPRGWQTANPWATLGGNYTITWTFSQPVPVSWIRFAVIDVNETSGLDYDANPPVFAITFGAGSTATAADFSLVDGDLVYSGSALRFRPGGPYRQSGHLQGNGGDTVTSITIVATGVATGDNIANSLFVRPACLTLQKTSENGTGSFAIDMANVVEADGSAVPSVTLATTAPGTPASSPGYYSIIGQEVSLSEAVPAGWNLDSAICTDQNAGSTGNPPVVGNFASPLITIPAGNVRPQADIRCVFTNRLLPAADLAVVKTTGEDTVVSGRQAVYTLRVSNNGPEAGDGARLTDPQPAGLDCSAGTLTCGNAAGGAVCPASPTVADLQGGGVVIPTLPAGGSLEFTLTCTVTASGEP